MKSVFKQQFKCKVCGDKFSDGWEHSLKRTDKSVFLVPIDEAHKKALDKFQEDNYEGNCPLCDSYIRHITTGAGEGWEISCDGCGYLFDED